MLTPLIIITDLMNIKSTKKHTITTDRRTDGVPDQIKKISNLLSSPTSYVNNQLSGNALTVGRL